MLHSPQDLSQYVQLDGDDGRSEQSDAVSVTTARGWPRLADNTRPELLSSDQWAARAALRAEQLTRPDAAARPDTVTQGVACCYRDAVLVHRAPPADTASTVASGATSSASIRRPPQLPVPIATQRRAASTGDGVQLVSGRLLLARGRRHETPAGPRLLSRRRLATIVDVDVPEEERMAELQDQAARYLTRWAADGLQDLRQDGLGRADVPALFAEDDALNVGEDEDY